MKKEKIASLFASLKIWGWVEKIQANLSIGLSDSWYDFYHILSEDLEPRNEYKGKIISLDSPFILWFWIKKIISLFQNAYKVVKICKKENIEVLIWQWDYFFMVSWLAKILWFQWKTIAVVHTTIWIWSKYINLLLRFFLSIHDKIVLISKEEFHTFLYEYKFQKEKLELIYNSIDISKIDTLKEEKVEDIDFNTFTFINIGRLTYQKWQDRLIHAFDRFNQKYPNSQLLILWDGELKQDYQELIQTLKAWENIHLLGNKQNVYKYLSKSDCFILSSNFEGFWLVLVEAMACSLPIISTDCPSWPSEILSGEKDIHQLFITNNAILVPYKDKTENCLYEAMEKLYIDKVLRKKLSENNLKRVLDFDVTVIMRKWDKFINNL